MLVVMHAESSPAEIDAICQRAREAGFEATVYDVEPAVIMVAGEHTAEQPRSLPVPVSLASPIPVLGAARHEQPAHRRHPPLVPPAILVERLPLPAEGAVTVHRTRQEVSRIVRGKDDRLIVVVGPCSIHDPGAALDYARRLAPLADELAGDLRSSCASTSRNAPRSAGRGSSTTRTSTIASPSTRVAPRPAVAAGCGGPGPARRLRVPRPDHPAIHRRCRHLGRHRRPPPRARCTATWLPASPCRSASRTAPAATSRWPSTR